VSSYLRAIDIYVGFSSLAVGRINRIYQGNQMKKKETYRQGSLVKPKGKAARNWRSKDQRDKLFRWGANYRYFVVALGHDVGHGIWLEHGELTPLTALEQLAAVAE